jgi:hypothetical protein
MSLRPVHLYGVLRWSAALLAALVLFAAQPAWSQAAGAATEAEINVLMERGDYAAALAAAERAWGPGTPNRGARIDFIRAMKLRAEGDLKGAVAIFRSLLADNPGFTRVRVELANTLVMDGDADAASYHLRDLARTAQSDDMRRAFENYLDAIKRDRPYRIGGYVSLAPSTNVNGQTSDQVIYVNLPGFGCPNDVCAFAIDQGSRAASGIGLAGGISGERHFFLSDAVTVTLSGKIDAIKYLDPSFDRLTARAGSHVRRRFGDNTIGAGVVAEYHNVGYSTRRQAGGVELEFGRRMGAATHLLLSTSALWQDYPTSPQMSGPLVTLGAVVGHGLAPGQSVSAGISFTFERTALPHLDNDGVRAFFGYSREWAGGFMTYVEPSIGLRRYRAADPSPLSMLFFGPAPRQDVEVGARLAVSHRKLSFMGFMPRFEYSYSRNFSNIVFNRRETHGVNVVLTRDF